MNWKIRFKNKTWLASFFALIVSFVYQLLALVDIMPALTQDTVLQAINILLMILTGMGVLIDPTTVGIPDSKRALGYAEPYDEK